MSTPDIVPDDARDDFWAVVEDCLREFHGMSPDAVRDKVGVLRDAAEGLGPGGAELFYHSEPFDVACDLAGVPLNVEDHLDRYLYLRDERHGGVPGV